MLSRGGIQPITAAAALLHLSWAAPSSGARSLSINPFVQIPQNPRGHAPDVTLAEWHGVVLALHALPVAAVQAVVAYVHQEGERHLEGVGDLALVEHEPIVGADAGDRRQDAKAREG